MHTGRFYGLYAFFNSINHSYAFILISIYDIA
jgi:hypothetical protein